MGEDNWTMEFERLGGQANSLEGLELVYKDGGDKVKGFIRAVVAGVIYLNDKPWGTFGNFLAVTKNADDPAEDYLYISPVDGTFKFKL